MYCIGIDIGGTFTDCAVLGPGGEIATIAKSPSTPKDPSHGVIGVLAVAAQNLGLPVEQLLAETDLFVHGCTVATNAMIERKGAKTGLLTTKGHEDAVFIGRVLQKRAGLAERELIHQSKLDKAEPPVITPFLVRGVSERVDSEGEVVVLLNQDEAARALDDLVQKEHVESLAISFLWSFVNPDHERQIKELTLRKYPHLSTAVAHEIAPVLGEYERTVTTVLTAYLRPKVAEYLQRLEETLKAHGFRHPMLVMQSRGGLTTVAEAKARPLLTLDSGPVGGTLGARFFGGLFGESHIIATDMGGTSFDVSLIYDGQFQLEEEPVIDKYTFFSPKVAISSIGAGGGSIVWLDPEGVPRVGPQSAGAEPGPACYDQGGTEPTVTDADLVLGYLNPDYFLGGRMKLNRERAQEALGRLAHKMGTGVVELAAGAFRIVNAQMADLIVKRTVQAGYDPRKFALFVYGGAGPTHATFFARELRIKTIYVPAFSTVFSALGMLSGDFLHSYEASCPVRLPPSEAELARINERLGELEERVYGQFEAEERGRSQVTLSRFAYMKYTLQFHEIAVEMPLRDRDLGREDVELLEQAFETKYEGIYGPGTGYRQAGIEIMKCRVDGIARSVAPRLSQAEVAGLRDPALARKGRREAYFDVAGGFVPCSVYDGARLQPGFCLDGPCIVERMGDTVVIPPGAHGTVDGFGNLRIDLGAFGAGAG